MQARRVVVTGIGALTPIGNNLQEYWEGLVNGRSGAAPITLFDATNFKTQFACEVKEFNPTEYLERKEARKLDRFCQFAMIATNEAFEDSKLDVEKINYLISDRNQARKDKNWGRADDCRDQLEQMGVILEDTPQGTQWKIK